MRSSRHDRLVLGARRRGRPRARRRASRPPRRAHPRPGDKVPVAIGTGGAVATVDADATRVGLDVLRKGGNAVDAAVAAAATLGVTEPFSSGIGGGGFFVYYDAATGAGAHDRRARDRADGDAERRVRRGRRADPVRRRRDVGAVRRRARDPADVGRRRSTSGGPSTCARRCSGATEVARRGFVVDQTFVDQTTANVARFSAFRSSADLFLRRGAPPAVGSVFRNRDLADTYDLLGPQGRRRALHRAARPGDRPRRSSTRRSRRHSTLVVRPGLLELGDLASYQAPLREPTLVSYRGLDVYGMAPPSSGGSTVGEALNILEALRPRPTDQTQTLHRYLEASALAFADRNRYVGDPAVRRRAAASSCSPTGSPRERACLINPTTALTKPVAPGVPDGDYASCPSRRRSAPRAPTASPRRT